MLENTTLLNLFKRPCSFIAGAHSASQIPATSLPEIAFIGRSNVGKSSLINSLVGQNKLARTSQTPGCTKQINFFQLHDLLCLVDLPGYGYARISNKDRNHWDSLIYQYLRGRSQLLRTFILIDSRHPFKELDIKTMRFLDDCAASYQIVFTKVDKISKSELEELKSKFDEAIKSHSACFPEPLYTSSKSKNGIEEMQKAIIDFINTRKI
ncbi:MAG: ribosome biogenesis GTP-binding protein YihA/YsxC [Alphaproteobacteria bacterium]|jgi:GTP-binding protein